MNYCLVAPFDVEVGLRLEGFSRTHERPSGPARGAAADGVADLSKEALEMRRRYGSYNQALNSAGRPPSSIQCSVITVSSRNS